jgi:hypothetical protein
VGKGACGLEEGLEPFGEVGDGVAVALVFGHEPVRIATTFWAAGVDLVDLGIKTRQVDVYAKHWVR